MKSNTVVLDFYSENSIDSLNKANDYANENKMDIVAINSHIVDGNKFYLIVVFKKQFNVNING